MKLSVKWNEVLRKWIGWFLLACIGLGVVLHIVPYLFQRSFWVDEAMLASTICTRSPSTLLEMPLDYFQSAPIGYLYIVKLLTMIFGTSKTVLRLWSLIAGLGSILVVYLLMRKRIGENCARLFTAIYSLADRYIYYSNELKQYMSDNLCCLLVLFVWQKYREKKLSLGKVVLIFAVLIWFSFAAVFFIAACMLIESLPTLKRWIQKRKKEDLFKLAACALVLLSFVLNYVLWLSNVAANAGGQGYWALLKFPLIPKSVADLKLIKAMANRFLGFYSKDFQKVLLFLGGAFIVLTVRRKRDRSDILLPFVLSLCLLCVASSMGFYPIEERLVQMYAIVLCVIAAYACDALIRPYAISRDAVSQAGRGLLYFFCYALMVSLFVTGKGGMANLSASHVYKAEISNAIKCLEANRTDDDVVYVLRGEVPSYLYETGYEVGFDELPSEAKGDSEEITWGAAPYVKGNLICGQQLVHSISEEPYSYANEVDQKAVEEDARCIGQFDSVYLLLSSLNERAMALMEELRQYGTVECTYDTGKEYEATLYHFYKGELADS